MAPIGIGQRIRVIDAAPTEYKQAGTVVAGGTRAGRSVRLDHDRLPDARTFFHVAELRAVSARLAEIVQVRGKTREDTL